MLDKEVSSNKVNSIDEYISTCDVAVQAVLRELRQVIKSQAPEAMEKISYGMPTFYLNGNLVHFAAQKRHIGFYPTPSAIEKFREDFEAYGFKYSKGAVQFPIGKVLPWELIERIVRFRVMENMK